MYFRW